MLMITIIDNIAYLLDEEKRCATVTKNPVPYSGDVAIPAVIVNGGVEYVVNDILDEAFAECAGLTSVLLGENVESIGIGAFEGCESLASVVFPQALHLVGMRAFKGCAALKELLFPANVIVIGREAFAGCCSLVNVYLPDNLINIEPSLFDGCRALEKVSVGAMVESVGE